MKKDRFFNFGIEKLTKNGKVILWHGSQVARQGSAKPLHVGSIPARASKNLPGCRNGSRN